MRIILDFKPKIIIPLFIIAAIYSFISVTLHNRFMTFGSDLGTFDEWIWKISQGKFPYSGVGCNWMLEDHFQIILYFLAPLYWVWNDVRVLLIAQSFAMVFAGLPLFTLVHDISKNKFFSFSIVFSYLFFIGTQFATLNEFHQITFAPFFIALAFLSIKRRNIKLFIYSMIFLLITKEDLALLVGAIGLGFLFRKEYRKLGLITAIAGFSFFFLLVYVFMPFISVKGVYDHFHFGEAGKTPLEVLIKSVTDPVFFLRSMVTPLVKLKTIFQSFISFALLPVFAPIFVLIPLFEDFATRFIYAGPQYTKWLLVNHHAAVSSILLPIASAYGVSKILNRVKFKWGSNKIYTFFGVLLILSTISSDIIFHGPINSIFKPQFYFEPGWVRNNREVISKVPKDVSVAAQNNLLPHLTHRDDIYRLPYGMNSQFMVVDLHNGPNKYAPLSYGEMKEFVNELLTTKRYSIVYQKGEAMLLKRNFKTDITKSKYYGNSSFCYYSYEER